MAAHDALTGLPNRLSFEQRLQEAHEQALQQREHALCFMDLDRFKIVNDSAGHAAGDAFLRLVGDLLKSTCGDRHFTARLGGDEFAVILHNVSEPSEVDFLASRIIQTISRMSGRNWGRKKMGITCMGPGRSRGSPLVNAEPAANVSPTHMRHRCRAIRGAPAMPPARTTLASAITVIASTDVRL